MPSCSSFPFSNNPNPSPSLCVLYSMSAFPFVTVCLPVSLCLCSCLLSCCLSMFCSASCLVSCPCLSCLVCLSVSKSSLPFNLSFLLLYLHNFPYLSLTFASQQTFRYWIGVDAVDCSGVKTLFKTKVHTGVVVIIYVNSRPVQNKFKALLILTFYCTTR